MAFLPWFSLQVIRRKGFADVSGVFMEHGQGLIEDNGQKIRNDIESGSPEDFFRPVFLLENQTGEIGGESFVLSP